MRRAKNRGAAALAEPFQPGGLSGEEKFAFPMFRAVCIEIGIDFNRDPSYISMTNI